MESIVQALQQCASAHGNLSAQEVLQSWQTDMAVPEPSEDFVGTAVFTLAAGALQGASLEERQVCVVGIERCLAAAAALFDADAQRRLQQTVLERTLRRFDESGDALAAKASLEVLLPGQSAATATEPLRAVLALLLRCVGTERITAKELLELVRGDVAVAVAVIAEGLAAPRPVGLPLWSLQLCRMLQQLTSPDVSTWLMQRADPSMDFSATPMAEFRAKQLVHCQVVALAVVQFDVLGHALLAAEQPAQRQPILAALIRAVHSLVGSRDLMGPGRLISRCVAFDFMRLGFRFLAPFARKLIDEVHAREPAKTLRLTCRVLSWLLVHAEADGNPFLAESLRPLAVEWLMRALGKSNAQGDCLLALLALTANCNTIEGKVLDLAIETLEKLMQSSVLKLEIDLRHWRAFTNSGVEGFSSLGLEISIPDESAGMSEPENEIDSEDEAWPGTVGVDWHCEGAEPTGTGNPCCECGQRASEGCFGEGYFEGLWYCLRCWDSWQDAPPEMTAISPWPLESGKDGQAEQCGSGALLLRAPGPLRCGISGMLLTHTDPANAPVHIPGSLSASYAVAFHRRSLERWHRRSGGRCPITGQPLDLKDAVECPAVTQALLQFLTGDSGQAGSEAQ
ncbi:unnamed protein product [Polarella glacialis]|uniref:Uncharacterized protein n=1 Tax=Polarella glacialis TaxID=89957 RepID=A0A813E6N1_POLGL|nr:unnamed protein product [Polarella glacialis]